MEDNDDSIYAFCYEHNRVIENDPDNEKTGAPKCDGDCLGCVL